MLNVFCDVMGALMILGFVMAVGIFSVAHLLVPTLLGAKWLHIVPLVQWLALATLLMIMMSSTNNVLIALGRIRWATSIIVVRLTLMVIFLNLFLPIYGVLGVAYATFATLSLVLVVAYMVLRRNMALGLRRVVYILYKPGLAALAMFLLVNGMFPTHWAAEPMPWQLAQLFAAVAVGGICFFLVLGFLWLLESRPEGPELQLVRLVHARTGLLRFLLPGDSPRG